MGQHDEGSLDPPAELAEPTTGAYVARPSAASRERSRLHCDAGAAHATP
eukprot:COSAG02_NODE_681_length_18539_cov_44.668925_3_plen_49_part_00